MRIFFYFFVITIGLKAYADSVQEAVEKLTALNSTRESMASTLDDHKGPITLDTFKQICMPIGKSFKDWGDLKGYSVRQVSEKNRNSAHAPQKDDMIAFKAFNSDSKLQKFELVTSENKIQGTKLYVRIPVVGACLHCHGSAEKIPEFIKTKYKEDKAFGYKIGELRGLYSVFIPQKTE